MSDDGGRDAIAHELNRRLGPEYLSKKPGTGGAQNYIEGSRVINLANEIFGFDGWSSEIRSTALEYEKADKDGRWNVAVRSIVRITLKNGSYHEDVGFGTMENVRSKVQGLEKAYKEASTDGLKRAMRQFGNALGNCLYDKGYNNAIRSINCQTYEFDPGELKRPAECAKRTAAQQIDLDVEVKRIKPELPKPANAAQSTPTPLPSNIFDSDDAEEELDHDTSIGPENSKEPVTAPLFVSAVHADQYASPQVARNAQFDLNHRSPDIKYTLPQNRSAKVIRKT